MLLFNAIIKISKYTANELLRKDFVLLRVLFWRRLESDEFLWGLECILSVIGNQLSSIIWPDLFSSISSIIIFILKFLKLPQSHFIKSFLFV